VAAVNVDSNVGVNVGAGHRAQSGVLLIVLYWTRYMTRPIIVTLGVRISFTERDDTGPAQHPCLRGLY
jgi:hypothetical protein